MINYNVIVYKLSGTRMKRIRQGENAEKYGFPIFCFKKSVFNPRSIREEL
jgi:hypothetical protein